MLLDINNTQFSITCQQYNCSEFEFNKENTSVILKFKSTQKCEDIFCIYCGSQNLEIHDNNTTYLKDYPIWVNVIQTVAVKYHRYKCRCCNRVFSEDISFKEPETRLTIRAAQWIKSLLSHGLTISAVSELTKIHWNTIRKIHSKVMEDALDTRMKYLKDQGYKPTYLAVDEFAIHKGHTYATCVMDLQTGDVLWVGKGRATEDFRKFFLEYDMDYLSEVKAFAMDMNASYNKLVEEYMPEVEIVYDRYHMQAQYGKEVLGVVRLNEARKHKDIADEIKEAILDETDPEIRRRLKQNYTSERRMYSNIKNSRWPILTNSRNLKEEKKSALDAILESHNDLAICYAMKEEMCKLFELTDPEEARQRWSKWFEAAKESGIEPLIRFANLKEKRLEGLISHATHQISTGKLEGLNNKIKVAKRIGYGYRNDDYFFTLVRYISIPSNFMLIPRKV